MKITFITTLFYVISTTPEFAEYLNLPLLKPVEAQAWGAVILSSSLIAENYRAKRAAAAQVKKVDKKATVVDEKKSE